ncbi:hypothetical protein LZ30DRAFT_434212 [Colletotrichum cereale]|nr:hypothetical protein LZ30DRAFT_434212 [Colletotrichum cereale]
MLTQMIGAADQEPTAVVVCQRCFPFTDDVETWTQQRVSRAAKSQKRNDDAISTQFLGSIPVPWSPLSTGTGPDCPGVTALLDETGGRERTPGAVADGCWSRSIQPDALYPRPRAGRRQKPGEIQHLNVLSQNISPGQTGVDVTLTVGVGWSLLGHRAQVLEMKTIKQYRVRSRESPTPK